MYYSDFKKGPHVSFMNLGGIVFSMLISHAKHKSLDPCPY